VSQLTAENNAATAEISSLHSAEQLMEREKDELEMKLRSQSGGAESVQKELQATVTRLTIENKAAASRIESLLIDNRLTEAERAELETEVSTLSHELSDVDEAFHEKEAELKNAQKLLQQAEITQSQTQAKAEQAETEIKDAMQRFANLEDENRSMAESAEQINTIASAKIASLKEENAQLQGSAEHMMKSLRSLSQDEHGTSCLLDGSFGDLYISIMRVLIFPLDLSRP
jgi:chromosome segregation ATPase